MPVVVVAAERIVDEKVLAALMRDFATLLVPHHADLRAVRVPLAASSAAISAIPGEVSEYVESAS